MLSRFPNISAAFICGRVPPFSHRMTSCRTSTFPAFSMAFIHTITFSSIMFIVVIVSLILTEKRKHWKQGCSVFLHRIHHTISQRWVTASSSLALCEKVPSAVHLPPFWRWTVSWLIFFKNPVMDRLIQAASFSMPVPVKICACICKISSVSFTATVVFTMSMRYAYSLWFFPTSYGSTAIYPSVIF